MSTKTPAESVKAMNSEALTKNDVRQVVWSYLESNNLASFPRPVYRRIPNFKGSATAAETFTKLDEFKSAKTLKVNPDKPQESVRFHALEHNKTLLVPTPRLRAGLVNKIVVPVDGGKSVLKQCSTSRGVREFSQPLDLDMKMKVDLIVLGSVAVSKDGYRIGKGEGYGDLEYAMLRSIGAVDDNTVVVTTVHECQIMEIPENIMQPHDVMVNYIVTKDDIIKCDCKRPQPSGILWSYMTPEKMQKIPILKRLRIKEREAGKDVTLKDGAEFDDNCPDEEENEVQEQSDGGRDGNRRRGPYRRRRNFRQRRRSRNEEESDKEVEGKGSGDVSSGNEGVNGEEKPRPQRQRRRRRFQRRRRQSSNADGDHAEPGSSENPEDSPKQDKRERGDRAPRDRNKEGRARGPPRRYGGARRNKMPTIFVGSIPRALRVSELKSQVRNLDVNPIRVIWHGARGYAFFQFTQEDEMNTALSTLRDFEVSGRKLRVEEANLMARRKDRGDMPDEISHKDAAATANED